MTIELEKTILRNLILNESYMRKVIPFVKVEYFDGVYRELFKQITKFVANYNRLPTEESIKIELDDVTNISDDVRQRAVDILPDIFIRKEEDEQWLLDTTEKWCQDQALHRAIMESITVLDGKHASLGKNALPDLLQRALAVCFDANVGHDYLENVDERYDFYHEEEERIPFDLEYFNTITKGGLPNKTLNICLAGTGVGKSLFMCHCAAGALSQGYNVLYVTLEMSEERIAERIDANLLNTNIHNLEHMSKDSFKNKVNKIAEKTNGKLIIKEYPTGQAHSNHLRALLNELKLKKSFKPEIVFIDYLNICASSRMKGMGGSINSYSYIKAIAEEIRGLAVEFDLPIVSATQTTRTGFSNSDPGLEDTSESFGLPATADLMFALISNDELSAQNQIMVKQLKNRYNDPNMNKRFCIGVDRSKMKLFDVDNAKEDIVDDGPIFDKSTAGERFKGIKIS